MTRSGTQSQWPLNAGVEDDRTAQLRGVVCELIEYGNAMARGDTSAYTTRQWDAAVARAWKLVR